MCLLVSPARAQLCFGPTPYGVGVEPSCVVMADLNADGRNDLIVANHDHAFDNRISVLINNGDGTFAPSVYYDAGDRPYWIATGDIDADGDRDVAVTNFFDTTISVFLNNGDGTLAPQVTWEVGLGPGFVVLADLDGDGDLDMAAGNINDYTVSILLNNGDGTFARQVTYPSGPGPYGIVAADLNNDGPLDLAISNHHDTTVSILLNNGDGTFAPLTAYPVDEGPVGNDAADLDGDGDLDLAVANTEGFATGTTISVLLNNGDGSFAAHTPYTVPAGPYTIKIADFNSDGFGDLATSHESGFATVFINNADGTFGAPATFTVGANPVGLDVGDLDGNTSPEVAVTCYAADEVWVLFNQYPAVVSDPPGGTFPLGGAIALTATAAGEPPLTYQWRRDGIGLVDDGRISGATTDTLTIDPATFGDAGAYTLAVTNDCGTVISNAANVVVVDPCPADIAPLPDGNNVVDVDDLIAVILAWGPCADCSKCPADIRDMPSSGNCVVDVDDLIQVILNWGDCG
jgi:uncharacterized repeat protein (TIGR01451 family)